MQFRISQKTYNKKLFSAYRAFILAFLIAAIIAYFGNLKFEDILLLLLLILIPFSISAYNIYFDLKDFKKTMQTHLLEINQDGLIFYNKGSKTKVNWEIVTNINLKEKSSKIKKLILKFENKEELFLHEYENAAIIKKELEKYVSQNLWKTKRQLIKLNRLLIYVVLILIVLKYFIVPLIDLYYDTMKKEKRLEEYIHGKNSKIIDIKREPTIYDKYSKGYFEKKK